MPTDTPLAAAAVRSETAVLYAASGAASPPPEPLLARIERAGPAALDDHELLGLVGIDIDAATLVATGGATRSLSRSSLIRATGPLPTRLSLMERWMAPPSIRASWCGAR